MPVQIYIYVQELLGTAFLTFALNIFSLKDYQTQAAVGASAAAATSLIFGQLNNGGHFNPAITIAVLAQRFIVSKKGIHSFQIILQNIKFAFILILCQICGACIGTVALKIGILGMS